MSWKVSNLTDSSNNKLLVKHCKIFSNNALREESEYLKNVFLLMYMRNYEYELNHSEGFRQITVDQPSRKESTYKSTVTNVHIFTNFLKG